MRRLPGQSRLRKPANANESTMTTRAILITTLAAAWLTGCGPGPAPTTAPAPEPQAAADEDFNAVWDAAVQTLRQHHFELDRTDRRAGVIATFPMVGQSWFEFWRADAATARDLLESSLHTIYRQATVTIRRGGAESASAPAGECRAAVEVQVWRSNRPAGQVTSASEAYEMFLDPEALAPERAQGDAGGAGAAPVALGRDQNLEEILAQRINSLAAGKRRTGPPR